MKNFKAIILDYLVLSIPYLFILLMFLHWLVIGY